LQAERTLAEYGEEHLKEPESPGFSDEENQKSGSFSLDCEMKMNAQRGRGLIDELSGL
jgi:hypothetical protein